MALQLISNRVTMFVKIVQQSYNFVKPLVTTATFRRASSRSLDRGIHIQEFPHRHLGHRNRIHRESLLSSTTLEITALVLHRFLGVVFKIGEEVNACTALHLVNSHCVGEHFARGGGIGIDETYGLWCALSAHA